VHAHVHVMWIKIQVEIFDLDPTCRVTDFPKTRKGAALLITQAHGEITTTPDARPAARRTTHQKVDLHARPPHAQARTRGEWAVGLRGGGPATAAPAAMLLAPRRAPSMRLRLWRHANTNHVAALLCTTLVVYLLCRRKERESEIVPSGGRNRPRLPWLRRPARRAPLNVAPAVVGSSCTHVATGAELAVDHRGVLCACTARHIALHKSVTSPAHTGLNPGSLIGLLARRRLP
jgi:hypothetical protein